MQPDHMDVYKDDSRYRGGVIRSAESPPTGGERLNPESRLPVDNVEFGRAEPPVFEAPREPVGPPEPQPSNAGLFAPIPRQAPIKGGWGSQAPVIAPDMKEPRQALTVGQMADTRQIPVEAQAPAPEGVISAAAGSVSPGVSVVPGNPNYKAEYDAMMARERQDYASWAAEQARRDALNQQAARDYDARIALENYNRFHRAPSLVESVITNASTVADRSPAQRGPIVPPVVQASPVSATQPPHQRNFIKEQQALSAAEQARQVASLSQQEANLKLDQQKRLTDLGGKLASATDPKQREQLQSTILSLLGKTGDWKVVHAAGAETLAPDGMTKLKGPDSIVLIPPGGGRPEILSMGEAAASPQRPTTAEGSTGIHNGKLVVYKNGKWEYA